MNQLRTAVCLYTRLKARPTKPIPTDVTIPRKMTVVNRGKLYEYCIPKSSVAVANENNALARVVIIENEEAEMMYSRSPVRVTRSEERRVGKEFRSRWSES